MKPEEIKLTYESLIALLQGKELHLRTSNNHFIFSPPFDGVFITHKQLAELRNSATMDMLSFLETMQAHKEKRSSNHSE